MSMGKFALGALVLGGAIAAFAGTSSAAESSSSSPGTSGAPKPPPTGAGTPGTATPSGTGGGPLPGAGSGAGGTPAAPPAGLMMPIRTAGVCSTKQCGYARKGYRSNPGFQWYYLVKSGDGAASLALAFTGNATRWKELVEYATAAYARSIVVVNGIEERTYTKLRTLKPGTAATGWDPSTPIRPGDYIPLPKTWNVYLDEQLNIGSSFIDDAGLPPVTTTGGPVATGPVGGGPSSPSTGSGDKTLIPDLVPTSPVVNPLDCEKHVKAFFETSGTFSPQAVAGAYAILNTGTDEQLEVLAQAADQGGFKAAAQCIRWTKKGTGTPSGSPTANTSTSCTAKVNDYLKTMSPENAMALSDLLATSGNAEWVEAYAKSAEMTGQTELAKCLRAFKKA